jgi:hypothetical protein
MVPCMSSETAQPAREGECSEKARLRNEYQVAAADYSRAVQVLSKRSGVLLQPEYIRIRDFSEEARLRSEAARAAMDRHISGHGC